MKHIFTGFGFGPIQSGLFAAEAFKTGRFDRIVIAEIDQTLVDAVRASGGTYKVNVAGSDRVYTMTIEGIEIYNPAVEADRQKLIDALSVSTEIATSLPSVNFYDMGENSVARLIAAGLKNSAAPATIIYTAENNNHAAEILSEKVGEYTDIDTSRVEFLNTVIGKMSQVTNDPELIKSEGLATIAEGFMRAFLVEEFNRILVTKTHIDGFTPGIDVFMEKEDLLPFEDAKLYGHNAIHAMLGYLAMEAGLETMDQLRSRPDLMEIARKAFIDESGGALVRKYKSLGETLFTPAGYADYADDLLDRMTNPFLRDSAARAGRDPVRKLGYSDRIFGTIRLADHYGIKAVNLARGAKSGLKYLLKTPQENSLPPELRFSPDELNLDKVSKLLAWLWKGDSVKDLDKFAQMIV
jgi:mannitol-1-phosphate 5-dehydrogenase